MGIKTITLEKITGKAANVYEAIVVTGQKARALHEDSKLEFNNLMNTFHPAGEDEFDDRDNTEQEKLSVEFEKREKPHITSLNTMVEEGIEYRYKDVE